MRRSRAQTDAHRPTWRRTQLSVLLAAASAVVGTAAAAVSRSAVPLVIAALAGALAVTEQSRRDLRRQLAHRTDDLHTTTERHEAVLSSSQEGVWVVDGDGRTASVNLRMAELLGTTVADLDGVHVFDHLDEKGRTALHGALQRVRELALAGDSGAVETCPVTWLNRAGLRVAADVSVRAVPVTDPEWGPLDPGRPARMGAVLLVREVGAAPAPTPGLRDEETGLSGRALFIECLRTGLARARRQRTQLAVIAIGFDRPRWADGEHAGEIVLDRAASAAVLAEVASRVSAGLRSDEIAARWADDQVLVLCEGLVDDHGATVVAERLLRSLVPAASILGGRARVAATAGIASSRGLEDAEDVLALAADALHRAAANRRTGAGTVAVGARKPTSLG